MEKLSYWKKEKLLPKENDFIWNIPEQKSGSVAIIGGNSQNFSSVIRSGEYLFQNYPIKDLKIVMPDSLKNKIPPVPGTIFCPSTESGSLADSPLLKSSVKAADMSIFIGDLSHNSATSIAIANTIKETEGPVLLARDSTDILLSEMNDIIEKDNLFIIASMAQLQKLFRAVYYPKVLLLSMPLMPVVEALHKFTLSYSLTILTFHEGQIIVAQNGKVISTPIEDTNYTPLSLWMGTLAMKIAAMNLYNPGKALEATFAAI